MKKIFFVLLGTLFLTGCGMLSTQPYIQTYYYDIGSPSSEMDKKNWNLEIMSFDTSGPYQHKMVFRTGPNSIEFDEFNRWSMTPAIMLNRYLLMVYDCGDDARPEIVKKYSLKGEIVQLEADLPQKKVTLALRLLLYETVSGDSLWTRTFRQVIPVKKVTGDSYAAAVKQATDKILNELDTQLQPAK